MQFNSNTSTKPKASVDLIMSQVPGLLATAPHQMLLPLLAQAPQGSRIWRRLLGGLPKNVWRSSTTSTLSTVSTMLLNSHNHLPRDPNFQKHCPCAIDAVLTATKRTLMIQTWSNHARYVHKCHCSPASSLKWTVRSDKLIEMLCWQQHTEM
jgi:hypothetical protein